MELWKTTTDFNSKEHFKYNIDICNSLLAEFLNVILESYEKENENL